MQPHFRMKRGLRYGYFEVDIKNVTQQMIAIGLAHPSNSYPLSSDFFDLLPKFVLVFGIFCFFV